MDRKRGPKLRSGGALGIGWDDKQNNGGLRVPWQDTDLIQRVTGDKVHQVSLRTADVHRTMYTLRLSQTIYSHKPLYRITFTAAERASIMAQPSVQAHGDTIPKNEFKK